MFEYLGFVTDVNSGQTTISFRVTNKCKYATGYVAIGTGTFTRMAPVDGSIYNGSLGTYSVSRTSVSGKPGFVGVKFETRFDSFNNGASDIFSLVVGHFNPDTTIQVQGKAGFNEETFSFLLSQTCPAPATPGLSSWLSGPWNSFLPWSAVSPPSTSNADLNFRSIRFPRDGGYLLTPSRGGTANWNWIAHATPSGSKSLDDSR